MTDRTGTPPTSPPTTAPATPEPFALLRTPTGAAALDAARDLGAIDPLTAAERMRAAGYPADLASAALTQARLRDRAGAKFGADAQRMYFTRDGLEQATRRIVATRRAERLAAAGISRVLDLGCGIGADTIAFAAAGLRVYAVDTDPVAVAATGANAEALGLGAHVTTICAEAGTVELAGADAVFCDPARRIDGRRVFNPDAYSPPWSFLLSLMDRVPTTVLKLGPGIDHDRLPAGTEAEWVSVRGEVVEAALWCGPLAQVPRRATVLSGGTGPAGDTAAVMTGTGDREAPVGPVRRYLLDPDGAVVRAHLVAELAEVLDANLVDPTIAYLAADTPTATRFGRWYEITDTFPFSLKRLRAVLRERGVGRVTITKRGSAVEPERLRRDLRLSGPEEATVVLTRVAGAPTVLLARPVPAPAG